MPILSSIIGRGLASARPAAGTAGRLYYSTDTAILERDNGSSWDSVEGTGTPADHNHTAAGDGGVLTNDQHDGYSDWAEIAAPSTPGANKVRLYAKDDGGTSKLYYKDDGGTEYELPTIVSGGGGSGAPSNATYVTTSASNQLSNEVLLSAVIGYGVAGSRPAAGTAGRLYYSTDTDILERDNGSSWDTVIAQTSTLNFLIDGGGSAITTGIKGDLVVDFAATITGVTMLADQSGSIVVDIWKDTYANFAPTDADSITASAVPTISSATKSQDTTLTGWTTSISAGDILRFNVDSVTSIQRVTVALRVRRA
jgi:hypothetical protein